MFALLILYMGLGRPLQYKVLIVTQLCRVSFLVGVGRGGSGNGYFS